MTRQELLKLVVSRSRTNGFQFRRWYTRHCGRPWVTSDDALAWLSVGSRYLMLLFSHEFALHFWKSGERITFVVPPQKFQRILPNGKISTIQRKSYTRRSSRPDAWKYHLREMAAAEEPLRYVRKYLMVEEDLDPEGPLGDAHSDETTS